MCSTDLAINGEVGNFETSVRFFTVSLDNDVCTLLYTPGKNIHIILSALY